METLLQPVGEPAGLIRKYYPNLGEQLPSPTLPELAAEWYFALARIGIEGLDYHVTDRHERASNKAEFTDCVAMLLAEVEQHAHLPGNGYRRYYPTFHLTPEREAEIEVNGRATLRAVREWHTLAILSPVEQFLYRARKIELWQNERHQLATREANHGEWREEYGVLLLALQRAVPTAKKKLLRAAYTELKRLMPTLAAGRPFEWLRLYNEGHPFFSSSLTATYAYSEFAPLRPTRNTTDQLSESFFADLHVHLFEKEWHVWQALILLAGALGEVAPPTPETFQAEQTEPAPAPQPLDPPAATKSVAELCCKPFTETDLKSLLQRLSMIDAKGKSLVNDIKGSGQARRNGFTAAYRVLQHQGLMEATENDTIWAGAFEQAYQVTLGEVARGHTLTNNGKAPPRAPSEFKKGVEVTENWIIDWRVKSENGS